MNKIRWFIFATCVLCLFMIGILIGCGFKKWQDRTREETSPETNETFIVQNNKDEPEWVGKQAALIISKQAQKADILIAYLYKNQIPNHDVSNLLHERWMKIRKNPKGLREMSFGEKSAAYTVNKGDELRICVRDKSSPHKFEDLNTGFFVLLHELAHLMSRSYGHGIEFKRNFAIITKLAVELDLYKNIDYSQNPTSYCNTEIAHSPY